MTKTQPTPDVADTDLEAERTAVAAEQAEQQSTEAEQAVTGETTSTLEEFTPEGQIAYAASLLMNAIAAARPDLSGLTGVTINPIDPYAAYRVAIAARDGHGTPVGAVIVVERHEQLPVIA